MPNNGNGTSGAIKIILFVGAVLGTGITIYSVFHAPLVQAIAQESTIRQEKDDKLEKELNLCVREQMITNQQILVTLAEIKTEIKSKNR